MTVALIAVGVALIAAVGLLAARRLRRRRLLPATPPAQRILFPFTGSALSLPALDAALRLARAERAVLVPAYLAEVPLNLPLASALPRQCEAALPILEAIEQRAARVGVAVDPRIERGRTHQHALTELMDHEQFDRIVAPAAANGADGFSADEVAWLLGHAKGDIVVFRSSDTPVLETSAADAARTLLD
jgi:hypothetical protein